MSSADQIDLGDAEEWGEAVVDRKGRVCIPIDIREQSGLETGEKVVVKELDDGRIVVSNPRS
jgi:AbrB family looped-hinge helix DNA binding protein